MQTADIPIRYLSKRNLFLSNVPSMRHSSGTLLHFAGVDVFYRGDLPKEHGVVRFTMTDVCSALVAMAAFTILAWKMVLLRLP